MHGIEEPITRNNLLEMLSDLGIAKDAVISLDQFQLLDLLVDLRLLSQSQDPPSPRHKPSALSLMDIEILRMLLTPGKKISCISLSRHFGVSINTAQRKRKRLEELIDHNVSVKLGKFRLRTVTFFVSTNGGRISGVGKEILRIKGVTRTIQSFNNNVDLMVDALIRDSSELLMVEEKIKQMKEVTNVFWIESIEVLGRNDSTIASIIESSGFCEQMS
jgi:hypothetical protein